MFDIIIIGSGITGSMLARSLSQYSCKIALLEKNHDIACGATMANSAIIHTGYDPEDGTLKAKLNVAGARMYEDICKQLECKYKQVGAWVVACGDEEERKLDVLEERAIKREIPYERINGDEAREIEHNLTQQITGALCFPTTAVIYPWEVAIACCEVAKNNGVEICLDTCVENIRKEEDGYHVQTNQGEFVGKLVLNASGTGCESIAKMVSQQVPYHVVPKKGEYYVLDQGTNLVDHIIFPVPGEKGKGVLAVPTVYGNILIGPNSSAQDSLEVDGTANGLQEVKQQIDKTIKGVPFYKSIRTFAGLRPSTSISDFFITEYEDAPRFIDIASIASPGLASAPAIAQYVIDNYVKKYIDLSVNQEASLKRQRPIVMAELSDEERNAIIAKNPAYGRIVCRCESISEGEIVDAILSPCGARSVKGVKKRVRPGMGRCQGGFCEPRVVEILARTLGITPAEVVLDDLNSNIIESENRI